MDRTSRSMRSLARGEVDGAHASPPPDLRGAVHPESVLTERGHALFGNFLGLVRAGTRREGHPVLCVTGRSTRDGSALRPCRSRPAAGDGVFDTALALGGRIVEEEAHLARLGAAGRRSASRSISERPGRRCGRWRRAIRARASAPPSPALRPAGLRPPAEPRPVLWAAAAPLRPGTAFSEVSLGWSAIRRNETSPASRHKTLGYLDAVLAAEAAGAQGHDEAVFLNMQGRVACAGIGTSSRCPGGRW